MAQDVTIGGASYTDVPAIEVPKTGGGLATFYDENELDTKMDKNNPTGTGSFSMNRKSGTAVGDHSFAVGEEVTASGKHAHAEGTRTIASGIGSHSEGYSVENRYTTASGNGSHAEGGGTLASGDTAHSEGYLTNATQLGAHAEGGWSTASGMYTHAEGGMTIASAPGAHSQGLGTKASSMCQTASGIGNVEDANGVYADIVGWGNFNPSTFEITTRKNISALTTGGTLRLKGDVYTNCADNSTGGNKLYNKPSSGIPASDLASGVIPQVVRLI